MQTHRHDQALLTNIFSREGWGRETRHADALNMARHDRTKSVRPAFLSACRTLSQGPAVSAHPCETALLCARAHLRVRFQPSAMLALRVAVKIRAAAFPAGSCTRALEVSTGCRSALQSGLRESQLASCLSAKSALHLMRHASVSPCFLGGERFKLCLLSSEKRDRFSPRSLSCSHSQ